MRVLIVGNAGEREPGRRFYSVERKLANGFTRNGHSVWFFSDRDVARASNVWRSSRAGRTAANQKFLACAREFAPEAILTLHSSLIATGSLAEAKALPSRPRVAQLCVDPLFRSINVAFLADRARVADATFVTTAGAALKQFANANNVCAFVPNPVDPSIETLRNWRRDDFDIDVFFAANASGDRPEEDRRAAPRLLKQTPGLVCSFHGFDSAPGIYGAAYLDTLGRARMGLNLNSDRAETAHEQAPGDELYLYNSDRVAQMLGCGLAVLSLEINQMMELFEPGREMTFAAGIEGLRDAAVRLKRDDAQRRTIAEAGWRKAHDAYNERLVARFIEDVLFRRPLSHAYAWPTDRW